MARHERKNKYRSETPKFDRNNLPKKGKKRFEKGNNRRSFPSRRREPEMTKVTCSSCGSRCEVPFKPTTNKPLLCKGCFTKGTSKSQNIDLTEIHKKLDKILDALGVK